jgi:hypothetical protein
MFLSEIEAERRLAATYCTGCPVWVECDQVGRFQRFGTWASKVRTQRPGRKLERDDEAA